MGARVAVLTCRLPFPTRVGWRDDNGLASPCRAHVGVSCRRGLFQGFNPRYDPVISARHDDPPDHGLAVGRGDYDDGRL